MKADISKFKVFKKKKIDKVYHFLQLKWQSLRNQFDTNEWSTIVYKNNNI